MLTYRPFMLNSFEAATFLATTAEPSPSWIRSTRVRAGLTQAQAARFISLSQHAPERVWQSYEAEVGQAGHRAMPAAAWSLFLLLLGQHPHAMLTTRPRPTDTVRSGTFEGDETPPASLAGPGVVNGGTVTARPSPVTLDPMEHD